MRKEPRELTWKIFDVVKSLVKFAIKRKGNIFKILKRDFFSEGIKIIFCNNVD